jgi:predicted acetyltransferase
MTFKSEFIRLVEPGTGWRDEFLRMLDEHLQTGEDYYDAALACRDFEAYVHKLVENSLGLNLPTGIVPMTTYWLIRDAAVMLGQSRLRHTLTPALEHHGGHIGYVIRPSQRQKGYGAQILALTLEKARDLGLRRVRITCDTDNLASARIIEKNGGNLDRQVISEYSGVLISQYWIELQDDKTAMP